MEKRINIGSFILSIACILLFFYVSFSGPIDYFVLGIHPLNLVLYLALLTFFLGLIGFSGVRNGIVMARSIITIIITLGLAALLTFIIFFGNLFS